MFGEVNRGVDSDVAAGAAWDIVDDLWEVDCVGNLFVVVIHPLRLWFVVVRRDEQQRVRTGIGGLLGEIEGFGRVVRAGARDDRHVLNSVDDGLNYLNVFGMAQCRRLTGRAHGNQSVDAGGFESLGVLAERFCVDLVVLGKGGHHRRKDPAEVDVCHRLGCGIVWCRILRKLCEVNKNARNRVATPAASDQITRFFGRAGRTAVEKLQPAAIAVRIIPNVCSNRT